MEPLAQQTTNSASSGQGPVPREPRTSVSPVGSQRGQATKGTFRVVWKHWVVMQNRRHALTLMSSSLNVYEVAKLQGHHFVLWRRWENVLEFNAINALGRREMAEQTILCLSVEPLVPLRGRETPVRAHHP